MLPIEYLLGLTFLAWWILTMFFYLISLIILDRIELNEWRAENKENV